MASVQALKSAIAEKYEEFGQHKFAKSFLESHEGLNSISLSRKNLGECIQWARLLYNSGEYGVSSQAITVLSSLVDDPADILNMIWAKLANLLVLGVKGDTAAIHSLTEDFKHIKSRLDLKSVQSQAQRMALSCAFIFYSIIAFVYLPQKETKLDFIFELFLEERNLSAIQLCSPVLLRYLVLIYMVSYDKKSLKIDHRTLANIIKSEVCSYQDTFTQFVKTLYIDFDLSGLKGHIEKIRDEVKKDILFSKYSEVIVESCRKMYFEVYSKIYSSVEVKTVAEFLGLGQEEAEIWIVNLFRKNNIKATVDEKNGLMVIGGQTNDDGEGLHKRAKELMARNRILLNNVSKVLDTK
jgi:translation initiation factor 3 subunit E